jgi:hypothetical protein
MDGSSSCATGRVAIPPTDLSREAIEVRSRAMAINCGVSRRKLSRGDAQ